MLMNLPRQVKVGESVPVTLIFEDRNGKRQTVDVVAPVKALNQPAGAAGMSHGKH